MKIRFTLGTASLLIVMLCCDASAQLTELELTETVLTARGMVEQWSDWEDSEKITDPYIYVAGYVATNQLHSEGACESQGFGVGFTYWLQQHDSQYAYTNLPAGNAKNDSYGFVVKTRVSTPNWTFDRSRLKVHEAWGSMTCRGVEVKAGRVIVAIHDHGGSITGGGASVHVPMDIQKKTIAKINVQTETHLEQSKGTTSLVTGNGLQFATLKSEAGLNQMKMRQKGGDGSFQIHYDPKNGMISWDASNTPAGEYEGHATVVMDYP